MIIYTILNSYDVLEAQNREMKSACESIVKATYSYETDLSKLNKITEISEIDINQFNI